MRGDDAHLSLHLEPIADHRGKVVEHLGEVSTRLALRQHGGHEEAGVDDRNPLRQALQRVAKRHAEVLAVVDEFELTADWRRDLVGDHDQTGWKRVPGPQRPREQLDGLRELLFEESQPLRSRRTNDHERHHGPERRSREPKVGEIRQPLHHQVRHASEQC